MPHRAVPRANRQLPRRCAPRCLRRRYGFGGISASPGVGDLRFRRQAPIGNYIVDFFCPRHRLIVELDGSQHAGTEALLHDAGRDAWLSRQGYRVMRVWNNDVMSNIEGVAAAILRAAQ